MKNKKILYVDFNIPVANATVVRLLSKYADVSVSDKAMKIFEARDYDLVILGDGTFGDIWFTCELLGDECDFPKAVNNFISKDAKEKGKEIHFLLYTTPNCWKGGYEHQISLTDVAAGKINGVETIFKHKPTTTKHDLSKMAALEDYVKSII